LLIHRDAPKKLTEWIGDWSPPAIKSSKGDFSLVVFLALAVRNITAAALSAKIRVLLHRVAADCWFHPSEMSTVAKVGMLHSGCMHAC
jgi:hypothetical protein